jgi:DNA-binding IclR family transcriptional regulator
LRAAKILESFTVETPTLTNSELAKKLGLNKSAITRLLQSLVKAGFISRDDHSKRYSLTHKLSQIGSAYVKNTSLHIEGHPLLEQLSFKCNENAQMGRLENTEVLYLDQIRCSQHIGLMSFTGGHLPAYCTGAGKLLLAYLSEEQFKEYCRSVEFIRFTPETIIDPAILKDQLIEIKKAGLAIVKSEFRPEVLAIAAPVLDENGEVIAAISLAGPVFRMDNPKKIKAYSQAVIDTARALSIRIGYAEADRQ